MNIIRNSIVRLVGRQQIDRPALDRFLEELGVPSWETDTDHAAEELIEVAGRTCYLSFSKPRPGGNAAYVENILDSGHGSVVEHAVWNFLITGVSRSFSHELVRHRAGTAFSQLSQRYVDESVAEYVCPDVIANDPELFEVWRRTVEQAHEGYLELASRLTSKIEADKYEADCDHVRDAGPKGENPATFEAWRTVLKRDQRTEMRKAARQAARSVLPNATETKIFLTVNARASRWMIEQRCSRYAEPEIRKVFYQVWVLLKQEAPNLFSDYIETPLPDGTVELTTPYRKV